jgi:hypothetical protein
MKPPSAKWLLLRPKKRAKASRVGSKPSCSDSSAERPSSYHRDNDGWHSASSRKNASALASRDSERRRQYAVAE